VSHLSVPNPGERHFSPLLHTLFLLHFKSLFIYSINNWWRRIFSATSRTFWSRIPENATSHRYSTHFFSFTSNPSSPILSETGGAEKDLLSGMQREDLAGVSSAWECTTPCTLAGGRLFIMASVFHCSYGKARTLTQFELSWRPR
jgi:hypothetical protein